MEVPPWHALIVLDRARLAYERAHVAAAARDVALVAVVTALAALLQPTARVTWLVAGVLAASLAALAWRGGASRRGAYAGLLAGLPPLVAPSLVFAFGHGGRCPSCEIGPTLACLITCFATSLVVGVAVGHRATRDAAPRRFALAALATASLTGLLACGTTGLGGASGIVIGLVAGGVTGWLVGGQAAHA